MKWQLLWILSTWVMSTSVSAQNTGTTSSLEQEIRGLDSREANAVLTGDFQTIDELWASDFVVNNPFNQVVEGRSGPIRTSALTYSSFVREIEAVLVRGDTVIVMGQETVVPKDNSPGAGETIIRRFTNIWMKREGRWQLTARHANNISAD